MGVPVYWPLSVLCVCVCVCMYVCVYVCVCVCVCDSEIKSEHQQKTHVSGLSKLDALWHKTHTKVLLTLRYQALTCVDP